MIDDFELKLLRGQIPGLPSENYDKHQVAVEFALGIGVETSHVTKLLSGAVLRTNEEIDAFDLSESADPWPAPDPADRQYVPMARIYICNMPDWAGDDYYEVGNTIPRHEGSFFD